MATSWLTIPQTGFGGIRCEWYRDDGATLMPEWSSTRRVATRTIVNGGVSRQTLGWNQDSLTLILEVLNADDARALRDLEGETDTLTLRADTGSELGTHEWIHDRGYRHHPNVTLVSLEPIGMRRNGRYRFRATFEKDHES